MAFIPQLCLNAVEELQSKEVASNVLGEESTNGLNIFEEESKESSEENGEDENNNFHFKDSGIVRTLVKSHIHQSLVNSFFNTNHYQSIPILNITPPPKV